ncbi:protein kinase domain-containing protein [Rhodococcus koreensis]|uniref:Non-specific serine/threonine protein kinase n=1 Tax=Rhodococcus koreensis TaxID=99653 RepID=A0A1H4L0I6_9NOCA|nr:protein kinase [Rhodococcus koreensis]SEB64274.1 non-specific serine/threonine protein kinase [Rhodococcus koreensis]
MAENDPPPTQRYAVATVTAELEAAGLDDAHEIGRGGFGVVYRCRQEALDRTVAVKILTADLDEENLARFFREQRSMGRLTGHPNIVNVLQVGATASGRPFIVMQYYPRGSLDMQIRRHGALPLQEALRVGVKMAGGLDTTHRLGILHRDIKPANILLTDYGEPALTDFGIAHISGGFVTATGTVTGSPAYTAPEVLKGDPPTPSSDLYSVGATLFCALTGHAAFERRSGEHIIAQFLRFTAEPVPDLRTQRIPDDLAAIVERAMSDSPQNRQTSAAAIGNELREIQARLGFAVDAMVLQSAPGEALAEPNNDYANPGPTGGTPVGRKPFALPLKKGSRGNLPVELTSFIGRRKELAEAKKRLSESHLVTLTGIGGVGKTRLALRTATTVQRGFADGVWLVELGDLSDETLLIDVVAVALGLREQSSRPMDEVLLEFLAPRELLLVLDNCERLVNAVASLAERLLRSSPGLRILATSRESLGIGGEMTLRVPPLVVPDPDQPSLRGLPQYDSVSLFTERATATVPTFTLTDDNKTTVALICQRLDGLPLPIELAAARLRAMSAEQILHRLTDRYALLTRGNRSAPMRQQTLRWCIDWSHDLCTPQEQLVWARLSVFAGSFELDAAEQICGIDLAPDELLDALASLVDKSILIREEHGTVVRFRLLDTLREYAAEKAEQHSDRSELLRRHRDWYLQLALDAETEWISPRQLEWIARLQREQPNLREALDFCLVDDPIKGLRMSAALFLFWNSRGLLGEGRRWLDQLLSRDSGHPTIERIRALCADSVLAEIQHDLETGAARVAEARTLANQSANPVANALIVHAEGLLALFSGALTDACLRLEKALELFSRLGDHALQIGILDELGLAYEQLGRWDKAIACHSQLLVTTEALGDSVYRSYALRAMAVAVWKQGDRARSLRLLEQALQLTRQVDDPLTAALCLEAMAWVAGEDRDPKGAVVLMGAAESLRESVGSSKVLFTHLREFHDDCIRATRQALGMHGFDAAYQEGKSLDFAGAASYALDEGVPGTPPVAAAGPSAQLTKREREVAALVAEGLTNRAIATRLVISPRTAQGHVEHVLAKLGFTSRAQIAAWVVDQNH